MEDGTSEMLEEMSASMKIMDKIASRVPNKHGKRMNFQLWQVVGDAISEANSILEKEDNTVAIKSLEKVDSLLGELSLLSRDLH